MSFYVNLGYHFKLPCATGLPIEPDGSIILSSTMPIHQLQRRKIDSRYPHMAHRLFDPQLYLASLDAAISPNHCANLASYPWFGVSTKLQEYTSNLQTQSQWRGTAKQRIGSLWPSKPPDNPDSIRDIVRDCIDFQYQLGCEAIILPSPLTVDANTDYSNELLWLDMALNYLQSKSKRLPTFVTVAIADICLRYNDPTANNLLDLILDVVSAREIDGVYIVLEQGGEPDQTRHCGTTRVLHSILHLVHLFAHDCNLHVTVNFLGQFGLVCEAVGAKMWGSGWYKSLYRLRIADKLAEGRSFPSYWTYNAAIDIHLNKDFDVINHAGLIDQISDETDASAGLLSAAHDGISVNDVPAWRYSMSNVTAAREHFLLSCMQAERSHSNCNSMEKLELVEQWLHQAVQYVNQISDVLGVNGQTRTQHVQAWLDAYQSFRRDHNA